MFIVKERLKMRLNNKIAMVTGAGQGIGRATVLQYAEEGARVIATDVDTSKLEDLNAIDGVETRFLDVRDRQAINNLARELPPLNILFNCAGYVHSGSLLECEDNAWEDSFAINVTSMYHMIQSFLPGMIKTNVSSSIINMASVASSLKGVPNRFAYSTTKAAVIGLTKSVAADFIKQGVRCNAICPGTVESPSLVKRIASQASEQGRNYDEVYQDFLARQPIGRIGSAREIAALATYLAADESAYTTGSVHVIDGGWLT